MRLREVPVLLIAPLGVAAALSAHGILQAMAGFGFGAAEFGSRAHAALEPAALVEIALALWLFGAAVRDALRACREPYYKIERWPRLGAGRLALWAGFVAVVAIATLFGMEFAESGRAALGLGWLGGGLLPGAIALLAGIAASVGLLYSTFAGRAAAFDRLVALFAAALARFVATLLAPAPTPQRISTRPPSARTAPVARHAGLRAPPRTTL